MFPRAVAGSVIDDGGGFGMCFCLSVRGNGAYQKISDIMRLQQNDKLQNIIQTKAIRGLNKPLIKISCCLAFCYS